MTWANKKTNYLNILRDTVHIFNSAAKALVKSFDQYVQQKTDDIFYEIQYQHKYMASDSSPSSLQLSYHQYRQNRTTKTYYC